MGVDNIGSISENNINKSTSDSEDEEDDIMSLLKFARLSSVFKRDRKSNNKKKMKKEHTLRKKLNTTAMNSKSVINSNKNTMIMDNRHFHLSSTKHPSSLASNKTK